MNDYEKMEQIYECYEQKIYAVVYSITNNVQQSEDIVQETFMTIYENLEKIVGLNVQERSCYILKMSKNKAIDCYRQNKRHTVFLQEYKQGSLEMVNKNIDEWEQLYISELQMDRLLSELKESYRQVFKYKVYYNLTYTEIADIMKITEANARKQFERARKKIQHSIGGNEHE